MKTKIISLLFGLVIFAGNTMPITSHQIVDIEKLNRGSFSYIFK